MIIGLAGKAGSGKSTCAEILRKQTGYTRYSLATPIKEFFRHLFWWDDEHLFGHLKETVVVTPFVSAVDIVSAAKHTGIHYVEHYHLLKNFRLVFSEYLLEQDNFDDGYIHCQYKISPRKALQLFGTEVCRTINENVWLDCAAAAYAKSGNKLIIDDVRFENEAQFLCEHGFIVNIVGKETTTECITHASEAGLDIGYMSCSINNTGTLKELERNLKLVTRDLLTRGMQA